MQNPTPTSNDIQYFPSPWWMRQQPYQFLYEPITRPDASNFQYFPAATPHARFVGRLPQLQESSTQPPPTGKASRRLPKLLPASAKFSVATSTPLVVSCVQDWWLASLLGGLNQIRQRLGRVPKHRTILADLFGGSEAIWILASIMLPSSPDVEPLEHSDLSFEAATESRVVHIEGKVLYVDLVECQEVCFKLTDETIEALLDYHDKVHCANLRTSGIGYNDIDKRVDVIKIEFYEAIHAFTFCTGKQCLEEMQDDGSGELSCGCPVEAKTAIVALFKPLPEMVVFPISINTSSSALDAASYSGSWSFGGGEGVNFDGFWPGLVDECYNSRHFQTFCRHA